MTENYQIPQEIEIMITDNFLAELRKELLTIFSYSSLDIIAGTAGTAGFADAFKNACKTTEQPELCSYWESLNWYDGDIFDDEVLATMVDRQLIPPFSIDDE